MDGYEVTVPPPPPSSLTTAKFHNKDGLLAVGGNENEKERIEIIIFII